MSSPKQLEQPVMDSGISLDDLADASKNPDYLNLFFDTTNKVIPESLAPVKKESFDTPHRTTGFERKSPVIEISRESRLKVRMLKIAGIPDNEVAKCMGISITSLEKYYKVDLDNGASECTAMVTGKLIEKIRNGDTTSIVFYLRTRGKWAPKNEFEITHNHTIRPRSRQEIEAELREIGVPLEKMNELLED